jgi:hypothetical protein
MARNKPVSKKEPFNVFSFELPKLTPEEGMEALAMVQVAKEEVDLSKLSLEDLSQYRGMSIRDQQFFHASVGEQLCEYLEPKQLGKLVRAYNKMNEAAGNALDDKKLTKAFDREDEKYRIAFRKALADVALNLWGTDRKE